MKKKTKRQLRKTRRSLKKISKHLRKSMRKASPGLSVTAGALALGTVTAAAALSPALRSQSLAFAATARRWLGNLVSVARTAEDKMERSNGRLQDSPAS